MSKVVIGQEEVEAVRVSLETARGQADIISRLLGEVGKTHQWAWQYHNLAIQVGIVLSAAEHFFSEVLRVAGEKAQGDDWVARMSALADEFHNSEDAAPRREMTYWQSPGEVCKSCGNSGGVIHYVRTGQAQCMICQHWQPTEQPPTLEGDSPDFQQELKDK